MNRGDRVGAPRQTTRQIFAGPIAVAVLSLIGLVAALTGDGARDILSWIMLAVPVAVVTRAWRRRT